MGLSYSGYTDIVKLLLGHEDIKVNVRDKDGYTPLMWASRYGYAHADVVKLLLGHEEIEVNVRDKRWIHTSYVGLSLWIHRYSKTGF